MKKILAKLYSSEGLRQSGLTVIGNTLSTGLSAIALMLISRLLGPEKFGEFSVGFAIVMIVTRFNDAGLSSTILKYASESNDKKIKLAIFNLTLRYKIFISLILGISGLLLSSYLNEILKIEEPWLVIIAFTVGLSTVYYEQLQNTLQSLHLFFKAVLINTLQAGFKLFTAIWLFLFNYANVNLTFALYVLAPLFPLVFLRYLLPKWVKLNLKAMPFKQKGLLINMAKHSGISFVLAGLIENVDVLFVKHYLNSYETGLLGGTTRISLMFSLIAYSLGNVLFPRVARYKSKNHLQKYLLKASMISFASFFGFLAFLPFSRLSIWLTIGPDYLAGAGILNILVAASFLAVASIPFIAFFYSFEAPWYFSISGIIQLVVVLVGNFVFIPIYGLEAAAWTRFFTRLALFVYTLITAIYIYRKKFAHEKISN